jgi:hypothetical protein
MKVMIANPAVQESHELMQAPNNPAAPRFAFDNTYARELEGFLCRGRQRKWRGPGWSSSTAI